MTTPETIRTVGQKNPIFAPKTTESTANISKMTAGYLAQSVGCAALRSR